MARLEVLQFIPRDYPLHGSAISPTAEGTFLQKIPGLEGR